MVERKCMLNKRGRIKNKHSSPRCPVEIFLVDYTLALFNRQDPVGVNVGNLVYHAARPVNFYDIYRRPFLKSEMQSEIVLRKITVAAMNFVNLLQITGHDRDARSDAVPITLYTNQLDQYGIVCVAAFVSQQLRSAIQIVNDHVDITIIIDVAKSGPS